MRGRNASRGADRLSKGLNRLHSIKREWKFIKIHPPPNKNLVQTWPNRPGRFYQDFNFKHFLCFLWHNGIEMWLVLFFFLFVCMFLVSWFVCLFFIYLFVGFLVFFCVSLFVIVYFLFVCLYICLFINLFGYLFVC